MFYTVSAEEVFINNFQFINTGIISWYDLFSLKTQRQKSI